MSRQSPAQTPPHQGVGERQTSSWNLTSPESSARRLLASTARAHHGESHSKGLIYHILGNDLSLSNQCLKCPPGFEEALMLLLLVTNTPAAQHKLLQAGKSSQLDKPPVTHTNTGTECLCLPPFPGWDIWGGQGSNMWGTSLEWTTELAAVSPRPLAGKSGQSDQIVGPHLSCFTTD